MPKKGATNGHQEMPDKKKNKPSKNRLPSLLKFIDAKDSPITYTSPNATIRSLISSSITSHDDFLSDFWEKKPAYLQGQWVRSFLKVFFVVAWVEILIEKYLFCCNDGSKTCIPQSEITKKGSTTLIK